MDLEKYRNYKDMIMLRPVNKKDENLFRHCAFGHQSFPNKFFKKDVEPMLSAHGVKYIKITDKSRKKKDQLI